MQFTWAIQSTRRTRFEWRLNTFRSLLLTSRLPCEWHVQAAISPARRSDASLNLCTTVGRSDSKTVRQTKRQTERLGETHDTLPSGWQLVRFHLASLTEFGRRFSGDKRSLLDHTRLVAQLDSGRESYLIVYKPTLPSVVSHSRFSLSAPRRFEKCG